MATTAERVKKLLVEHLGVEAERVTDQAQLGDDLGCDSLDLIEVEMALEEEFGIDLADDSTFELGTTVEQVVATAEQHIAS